VRNFALPRPRSLAPTDSSFISFSSLSPYCRQGALGNCWLISAIASLAGARPSIVRAMFGDTTDDNTVANEVGVYSVRLWDVIAMDWCFVIVDDLLPLKASGELMFANTRSGNVRVSFYVRQNVKYDACLLYVSAPVSHPPPIDSLLHFLLFPPRRRSGP